MVRFLMLGRFQAIAESGAEISVNSDRARSLLALLLLHRNCVVTADELIDSIWGDSPPASARKNIQTYVWRLRQLFGERLERRGNGYLLRVGAGELDLDVFEDRAAAGERLLATDPRAASAVLSGALRLWRGAPMSDVIFAVQPRAELTRLTERRLSVLESRIEADLSRGRDAELVAELRQLVEEYPYRERLHVQLMITLSRCGRRVEALNVFSDVRGLLLREFGLDPGPALQEVQAQILGSVRAG
jgi:DNA-binding SARP family transcriptional activator